MHPFEYANPTTPAQALRHLQAPASAPLAGGSDLLALMKDGVETPSRLVNLKSLKELRGIRYDGKTGLRIGAMVTLDEVATDPALKFEHSVLGDAFGRVGGPQVRNVATVGGNLCQRPRCWYYRSGFGLLPMRDGESMVMKGDNRYHAIFGNDGPAAFVSPSTVAPLLVALGAQVALLGPQGERRIDLGQLYRIPAKEGEREHDLQPGEIVAEVVIPPVAGRRIATYEVRQRETHDWPLATASVVLEMDGAHITRARVVLGQVAPIHWTAKAAEDLLAGKVLDRTPGGVTDKAAEAAVEGAKPLSKNGYKVQLVRTAVKRALLAAAGMEV